jgi:hypothetical protein
MRGNRFNHFGPSFRGHLYDHRCCGEINGPLASYSSGPPKRLRRPLRLPHGDVNVAPEWLFAMM